MARAKVVVVGAGSAAFGPSVVAGVARRPALAGVELYLHDVDAAAVARMEALARLLIRDSGVPIAVRSGTALEDALDGATCVVLAVAVDRERTWRRDREICRRHGIDHYAENGGPAAIAHTARNLDIILPIARAMEQHCPDAWLLNYTNPVARITTALHRYTRVRNIGICHQLAFGYFMAGVLLAPELGITPPTAPRFRWTDESIAQSHRIALAAEKKIAIRAAGINHCTWALSLTSREDGRDLYPLLKERFAACDPSFEPLSRKVCGLFDVFPVPGDSHLVEYLPYTHNMARGTWERNEIQMYDFAWAEEGRRARVRQIEAAIAAGDVRTMGEIESERAELIIEAIVNRTPYTDEALNLPNDGAIANLPTGAVVETPAAFLNDGPYGLALGTLPESVAEICRRQIRITELSVAGIVEKDRNKLREALALDPMVDDPDLPDKLLQDLDLV